jgi:glycosyltransferase involved in cell wall biosynthesis
VRILLITEFFPPVNVIASLRLYSFAKYWQKAGHEITVLTTVKREKETDLDFDLSPFTIIKNAIPFLPQSTESNFDRLSAIRGKKLSSKVLLKKFYDFIRDKTGCFSTHFPTFTDFWAKKSIKSIDAQNFDLVLSSGGPYSVHLIGLALKKQNPKIKWIIDWRDLWTKDPYAKGFFLFYPYEKFLENKFHKNADLITSVSEANSRILEKMTQTTVKTIYNGFDPDDFSEILKKEREKANIYTLVYVGSFYSKLQEPSPLFAAVSLIKKKNRELYDKIKIIFAGPNSDISNLASGYDVSEVYSYIGYIKHEETLKLLYDAFAVLFFDYNRTVGVVSAKIFEYMYISRKIMFFGENLNSSAAELLKQSNTSIFLGEDVNLIAEYLIKCLNNPEQDIFQKNHSYIQEYTRENQAKKLLDYIL